MSKIRVWTSDGQWSAEIPGLDKVYLIKTAIRRQCDLSSYDDAVESLDGFEINHYPVSNFLINEDYYYYEDGIVDHQKEEWLLASINKELPLSQVEFFIMPLAVLKGMQKGTPSLSAKYDQIISAVKAPVPTPKGYCISLRFEDE